MKNISQIIAGGKMSPRDIISVIIHNDLESRKNGKFTLDESEREAIKNNIRKLDEHSNSVYATYYKKFEAEVYMNMDLQTVFLNTQVDILRVGKLADYLFWKGDEHKNTFVKFLEKDHDREKVLNFLLANSGLEYSRLIHRITWESTSQEMRDDLLALYPDIATEIEYLEDEEMIFDFFQKYPTPTDIDLKNLAVQITDRIPWDMLKHLQSSGLKYALRFLTGYVISISGKDIVKKMAEYQGLNILQDEDLELLVSKTPNLKKEIEDTFFKWLKDGLFQTEFTPLCKSSGKATVNGVETKKMHREIIEVWVTEKKKAKEQIDNLIERGKLETKEFKNQYGDLSVAKTILLGTGIYELDEELTFVKDYKKQVDLLFEFAFCTHVILNKGFTQKMSEFKSFETVYFELSTYFNLDYGEDFKNRLQALQDLLDELLMQLTFSFDRILDNMFFNNDFNSLIEVDMETILAPMKNIQAVSGKMEREYRAKLGLKQN